MPAEHLLGLKMNVAERAAGEALLTGLDDGAVLRMDVQHRCHGVFTGEALAGAVEGSKRPTRS